MCLRLSHGWQTDFILAFDSSRPGVAAWCMVLRRILRLPQVHGECAEGLVMAAVVLG